MIKREGLVKPDMKEAIGLIIEILHLPLDYLFKFDWLRLFDWTDIFK